MSKTAQSDRDFDNPNKISSHATLVKKIKMTKFLLQRHLLIFKHWATQVLRYFFFIILVFLTNNS